MGVFDFFSSLTGEHKPEDRFKSESPEKVSNVVQIFIDNKEFTGEKGQTILDVAKANDIHIPTLCYHSDLTPNHQCGVCVVEVEGESELFTACSTQIKNGMKIITNSQEVKEQRKINTQKITSQQCSGEDICVSTTKCELSKLARDNQIDLNESKKCQVSQIQNFGPAIQFNQSKCISCLNCVEACNKFSCGFLEFNKTEDGIEIVPSAKPDKDCIYCGQCIMHCPVGVFREVSNIEDVEKAINDNTKTVVMQFAPSIRTSIGEEFGLGYGQIVTDQLSSAIKKLGADYVFDVSVGADFTTYEEAGELVKKLKSDQCNVMFSSCCPSWVKYIEFYYPEFIPNIASVRSPQTILGGLIKTYFAKKMKLDSKNIIVISIMPCTAKKYEITKSELEIDGIKPVDYVITTRELARMFKTKNIDLAKIKPESADNPLGIPSGAGVIYGASGGVMESALRTAYAKLTGKKLSKVDFQEVRGLKGIKTAEILFGDKTVKVAVANGIPNAQKLLEELKQNPKAYNCIEVMACPGGCIGGGGQPLPASNEIRQKRAQSLYDIDDKSKIRMAHENPVLKQIYSEFLTNEELIKKICHTHYQQRNKEVAVKISK